jgi:hypothetical protein
MQPKLSQPMAPWGRRLGLLWWLQAIGSERVCQYGPSSFKLRPRALRSHKTNASIRPGDHDRDAHWHSKTTPANTKENALRAVRCASHVICPLCYSSCCSRLFSPSLLPWFVVATMGLMGTIVGELLSLPWRGHGSYDAVTRHINTVMWPLLRKRSLRWGADPIETTRKPRYDSRNPQTYLPQSDISMSQLLT